MACAAPAGPPDCDDCSRASSCGRLTGSLHCVDRPASGCWMVWRSLPACGFASKYVLRAARLCGPACCWAMVVNAWLVCGWVSR